MAAIEDLFAEFKAKEGVQDVVKQTWYIVAAVALAASSAPEAIPPLYRFATKDLDLETQKLVQRRIKEALLKTQPFYGSPKSLQAHLALFKELRDEEIDHYGPRYASLGSEPAMKAREERGKRFFEGLWTPAAAKANLEYNFKYSPDLYLMTQMTLEWYVAEDGILDFIETEMTNSAALICSNCPTQAMWHTRGIVRHGGTKAQARFVQELALKVAERFEVKTGSILGVDEIDFEDERSHA